MTRAKAVEIKLKKKKSEKTTVMPKRQAKWTHAKSRCVVSIKCQQIVGTCRLHSFILSLVVHPEFESLIYLFLTGFVESPEKIRVVVAQLVSKTFCSFNLYCP